MRNSSHFEGGFTPAPVESIRVEMISLIISFLEFLIKILDFQSSREREMELMKSLARKVAGEEEAGKRLLLRAMRCVVKVTMSEA